MRVVTVGVGRRDEWNALAARGPAFTLMQSWEWGTFKQQLGWRCTRVAVEDGGELRGGAQVLVKRLGGMVGLAYVPRGPIGDWLDPPITDALLRQLHVVARGERATFLRIEPAEAANRAGSVLRDHGFHATAVANQPVASILVDLRGGDAEVLARMHRKTRYNIRLAARRGITVREGSASDLDVAHRMLRATAGRNHFPARSARYHRAEWSSLEEAGMLRLFVAEYDGEPVAVNISAVFGRVGAYLHGASSGAHHERMPNHLLMFTAMRWARDQGATTFDLWGIPAEVGEAVAAGVAPPDVQSTDGLWGVYRFKRGFSDEIVAYAGAFDHPYSRRLYAPLHRLMARATESDRRPPRTASQVH